MSTYADAARTSASLAARCASSNACLVRSDAAPRAASRSFACFLSSLAVAMVAFSFSIRALISSAASSLLAFRRRSKTTWRMQPPRRAAARSLASVDSVRAARSSASRLSRASRAALSTEGASTSSASRSALANAFCKTATSREKLVYSRCASKMRELACLRAWACSASADLSSPTSFMSRSRSAAVARSASRMRSSASARSRADSFCSRQSAVARDDAAASSAASRSRSTADAIASLALSSVIWARCRPPKDPWMPTPTVSAWIDRLKLPASLVGTNALVDAAAVPTSSSIVCGKMGGENPSASTMPAVRPRSSRSSPISPHEAFWRSSSSDLRNRRSRSMAALRASSFFFSSLAQSCLHVDSSRRAMRGRLLGRVGVPVARHKSR
eukprot:scaffold7569_cov27-Tisochrysis_lutea.AAC.5